MLDLLKKRRGSLRWPPRQRFLLTEAGRGALVDYNQAIERYHATTGLGRDQLEQAQREWALLHKVVDRDASILSEFGERERLPREGQAALGGWGGRPVGGAGGAARLF